MRRIILLIFSVYLLAVAWAASAMTESTGAVIWKGDGEQSINSQWAEYSTTAHCAVTSDTVSSDPEIQRVSAPVAQLTVAIRFWVKDGDNCYGERSELGQALPSRPNFTESRLFNQGDNRWIAFQVNLATGFPIGTSNWQVIAQWKQLVDTKSSYNGCSPVLALQIHNSHYYLERANPASPCGSTISYDLGVARTGIWTRFTFHIIFKTSSGTVAIYDNTGGSMHKVLSITAPTLANENLGNGSAVPSHARIGIYRNSNISGGASLTYDGYTVATTRLAAENNAY